MPIRERGGGRAPLEDGVRDLNLAWSPRLRVTGLSLKTEDETYTGRGNTLEDGRLLIQLSNGAKEMRMVGPIARLKLEDSK